MISIEQLAEVIRDNIHPGEEGPLGDLFLDCAGAVLAAIQAPDDAPAKQTMTSAQWGENDGIVARQVAALKADALDAARFRFIRDILAQSFEYDTAGLTPGSARLHVKMDAVAIVETSALAGVRTSADALPVVLNAMLRGFPQYQPGDKGIGKSTLISEPKTSIPMPEGAEPIDPLTGTLGIFECQNCQARRFWTVSSVPLGCPSCLLAGVAWKRLPNGQYGSCALHAHRMAPEPLRSGMSDDERQLLCLVGEFAHYSLLGNFSRPCAITARALYELLGRIRP